MRGPGEGEGEAGGEHYGSVIFPTAGARAGLTRRMNLDHTLSAPSQLSPPRVSPGARPAATAPAPSARAGRRGFERVRKPVAVACGAAWLALALALPTRHGALVESVAVAGHLLVVAAVAGRLWSTLHIGGLKNGRLCRSGPYARTRNPLYFFSWLGVTGLALLFRQPWLLLAAWAGFAVSFAPLVRAEERRLAALFGAGYAAYRAEVPRFFPHLRMNVAAEARSRAAAGDGQTPGKLTYIERAVSDAVWFLIAAVVVEALVAHGGWGVLQAMLG